jgi:hypothetical protein
VAQSIYLHDPDGNAIEVYVDTSDVWRTDPRAVASISPLTSSKTSVGTNPGRRSGQYQRCRASPSTKAARSAGKRRRPQPARARRRRPCPVPG